MSDDTKLNSAARKLVVSNWFDTSLLRVRVTRGVIHLQGHIQRVGEGDAQLRQIEANLRRLDEELRMLRGFRGVTYLFDNWRRDAVGGWRFLGTKRERDEGKQFH